MAERKYTVQYLMPMGVGSEFGVKEQDMAKGMDTVGKQGQWLSTTEYGMAVFNSLKGQGLDVSDVKDSPVFSQRQGGKLAYWVPFSRWWQHTHPVGYKVHYIPLRVEVAQPSAEERQETLQQELEKRRAELATKLEEAKANLEMQKIQAEINKVNAEASGTGLPGTTPLPGMPGTPGVPTPMTFRTFEVFGMYNNAPMTLMQVLQRTASGWAVIPGAKVLVTTIPNEGFGLSGTPGRWQEFYPNRSPTEFGLDADKGVLHMDWQQRRPFVVPAQQLGEIFGPNWRTVVFT